MAADAAPTAGRPRRSWVSAWWGRARAHPVGAVSLVFLLIVAVCAVAAPVIAPHDPTLQTLRLRLRPPAFMPGGDWAYPLGTDALGRDVLSRVIFGARISLVVGISTVVVQSIIGVTAGLVAGYFGGAVDNVVMRVADVQQSIPFLVLVVAVAAVVGPSLLNTIVILGVIGWVTYGRLVRAEVLGLVQREYVMAARALGGGDGRIMLRHLLPNLVAPITVVATLTVSTIILVEASLSFLGLGVPPPTPTWGGMVADGRNYLATSWWVSVMPGAAIFFTVLAINLVGDWLREATDPALRR